MPDDFKALCGRGSGFGPSGPTIGGGEAPVSGENAP